MTNARISDLEPQLANFRDFCLGWAGADRLDGDIVLYRSGVAQAALNGVLCVRPGAVTSDLDDARRRLTGVPWTWWVGADSRPGLADELLAHGAVERGALPFMAVRLDQVTEIKNPPGLVVTEVGGEDLTAWVKAYGGLFGATPEQINLIGERIVEMPYGEDLVRFAGWLDGQIVGIGCLFHRHAVAGVYSVVTAKGFRRRGIAARLTAAALHKGRERGSHVGTLLSSEAGIPLYQRLGFEPVAEHRIFALPQA
jgi:ribosomal protein S18 acetylase RimI-like enzyme